MKKLYAAALAALILTGCASSPKEAAPTVIEGRFIGYGGEYVEFFLTTDTKGEYREIPLNVAEDGTFRDTIMLDKHEYDAALFADRFMFRVCVEPGKSYHAEFDLSEPGVETDFRFSGEGEKENEFMKIYWSTFTYVDNVLEGLSGNSFKDFKDGIESIADGLRAELSKIDNAGFRKHYLANIEENIAQYSSYYAIKMIANTGQYEPEKDFIDFMSSRKLDDEYMSVFAQIVAYSYPGIKLDEVMKACTDMVAKKDRKAAAEQLLKNFVGAGNTAGLADGLAWYQENFKDIDEEIVAACAGALSLEVGTDAPDIECVDIEGNVHHISDFIGKPLYIDLWASWCGPCCAEIPHLAKMVEALGRDPEIVCISISIDEDRDSWIAKLAEEHSSWPQFLATEAGQASVSKVYNVAGIPRFLLIDAEGRIASLNAPRPSDPNIIETLKSLL